MQLHYIHHSTPSRQKPSNPGLIAFFAQTYRTQTQTGTGKTLTERSNPVGGKLANELGLYDMSGNVWEWTWDWYAADPTGTQNDYLGAASGALRVIRGGSWNGYVYYCTVAYRNNYSPYGQNDNIGFRVVRP